MVSPLQFIMVHAYFSQHSPPRLTVQSVLRELVSGARGVRRLIVDSSLVGRTKYFRSRFRTHRCGNNALQKVKENGFKFLKPTFYN